MLQGLEVGGILVAHVQHCGDTPPGRRLQVRDGVDMNVGIDQTGQQGGAPAVDEVGPDLSSSVGGWAEIRPPSMITLVGSPSRRPSNTRTLLMTDNGLMRRRSAARLYRVPCYCIRGQSPTGRAGIRRRPGGNRCNGRHSRPAVRPPWGMRRTPRRNHSPAGHR